MYYIDSLTQRNDQFDFDLQAHSVARRRPLAAIDPRGGCPDGLTVDSEGAVLRVRPGVTGRPAHPFGA
jgi:sugar lactone lactonase YvrE